VKNNSIKSSELFEENKRRGNLPSLIGWREFFIELTRFTSPQGQSREIASRVQQHLTLPAFNTLHTEARNDEMLCKRRKVRRLHQFFFI
jgi:hypothetical protein